MPHFLAALSGKTMGSNLVIASKNIMETLLSMFMTIFYYLRYIIIPSSYYHLDDKHENSKQNNVIEGKQDKSKQYSHESIERTSLASVEATEVASVPAETTTDLGQTSEETSTSHGQSMNKSADLFPNISSQPFFHDLKLCSSGITSSYLPVKNEQGKFEWKFSDEFITGDELDAFKLKPNNSSVDDLSPTVSHTSSNIDSIISDGNKQEKQLSPPTTHSSPPFTPGDGDNDMGEGESESPNSKDSNKLHQCPQCDATFKIRGYLTRHLKKHATKKAYSCPFHQFSIYIDDNNITHKCHPNGGFSRRDTYKTHLKSRHFKYPKGTKTKDRVNSLGNCSMCGEFFPNAEIWCELHVEGGECKFLPVGFKGKSRIKNRLKRQLKHGQSFQDLLMPNEAINHEMISHDISNHIPLPYSQRHLPPSSQPFEQNFNIETPTSDVSNPAIYDYRNSPISISSSIPVSTSPNHFKQNQININQINQTRMNNHSQNSNINMNTEQINLENHMTINSHTNRVNIINNHITEYDDEFCLDTDQLNFSWGNRLNHIEPV